MKKYIFLFLFLILSHFSIGQDISTLLSQLETQKGNPARSELMHQVAGEYQRLGAYKKAIEYYEKSLQIFQASADDILLTKNKISQSYAQLKDYKNAVNTNEEILEYYRTHAQEAHLVKMLNETSEYCQYGEMYDKALTYNTELIKIHQKNNNLLALNQVYNNLGIIYRRQGNKTKSVENFIKAVEVNKTLLREKKSRSEVDAFTQINTGVTYLQLSDYKKANFHFEEAIKIADNQNDKKLKASAYNFGAIAHYLSDENNTALTYVTQAQGIAEENKDDENLLIAYQTLSQIYQSEEDYKDAQDFQLRYQELKSKLEKQKQQAIQQSLEKEVEVEKKESEMKSLIAEKDRQEAALKQSELERQKQEQELKLRQNELDLLRKNQELQASKFAAQEAEQKRIQQLLELTKQKAETEKQKAETEKQRLLAEAKTQEAERQSLIAKQKQLESNSKSRDLLSARFEQKVQAEQFKQEKYIRYLGVGVIGLVLGILFFVYRGLRITKKLNNQLSDKNKEIEQANIALYAKQEEINVQNEELQQTQEEVIAQRDAVELANRSLEKTNQEVKDSITYASRIQQAVLPSLDTFRAKLPESFVLYKPRDIVSGDFYWLEEVEHKIILIVADCTGHGVPGAFTSMLGGAGLAEIVFQKRVLEPDKILNELHLYIRNSLKQKVTQSRDGMDVAIAVIDKATNTLSYAGAKNPILFIQNGELQLIKGDKMPIGGEQREIERIFTKHTIPLDTKTTFYLFSDGYQDQFGGIKQRKFSSAQMRDLLFQIHEKDMNEQKDILKETIEKWQEEGNEEQLDDILVVGVRV